MPIRFQCESCRTPYAVKDDLAGKRTKCAKCEAALVVPVQEQAPTSASEESLPSRTELMHEILDSFNGEAPRPRTSLGYRIGMLVVVPLLLVLPIAYLLLIGVAGAAVYVHAIRNYPLLRMGLWVGGFLYIAPLFAGCVIVVFMIKPLFSRPPSAGRERYLDVGKDPLVFALVARLAKCIHAPQPRRIRVDGSANASASFGSWLGVFFGGDLVLTIGLPLAAGLSARQFAGVLAHELGHLAQGHAMRLGYVVRSINGWFARVVYERDSWDESLVLQSHAGGWGGLVALFARGCVGIVRGILWCWMIVGHALSCYLLRQMERDADSYEIYISGSEMFEATSRRLLCLNLGQEIAGATINQGLANGKLPNDFIALSVAMADSLPAKLRKRLAKECMKERTGFLDTHPAIRERIAQAQKANAPGVICWKRPASVLFENLGKHQRAISKSIYRQHLGRYLDRIEMVETITALASRG